MTPDRMKGVISWRSKKFTRRVWNRHFGVRWYRRNSINRCIKW